MIISHPFPSPYCPGSLTGDPPPPPPADARHLAMDRPSQPSFGQIGPTTVIPYPRPCHATTPLSRNRDPGGEPSRTSPATGLRPVRPPSPPPNAVPPPSGMWAHAHGAVPAPFPHWRAEWAACPRGRARLRSAAPKSPLAQLAWETSFLFLFPFSFPYLYILIFYAPKIV
jgi:hypothetical protein